MIFCLNLLGVTLSVASGAHILREGISTISCISASGSIPDSYSIDFSVLSYDSTTQSTGKIAAVDGECHMYVWSRVESSH